MQVHTNTKRLLGLAFFLWSFHVAAATMLNGIGIHKELGQELFMGALYSDSLSNDASTLISSKLPMRMEIKVLAHDGIATRRFSRMWIESMAINSKADFLTAQADNMVAFDSFFKGRILPNDHIVFTSNPGSGVDVSINGVTLGNIKDNRFFTMLLATWIGSVPLASDFKDDLLKMGDVNANLRARYEQLQASSSRTKEINNWASKTVIAEETKTPPKKEAEKVAAIKNEREAIAKTTIKPELPDLALNTPKIERPSLDVPRLTNTTKEAVPQASSTPIAQQPIPTAKIAPSTPVIAHEDDEDDEAGPALTTQSLLARQFYVSDALKKVTAKIKYPQRAQSRGQEGSVRIGVVIDRQGNVLSTSRVEESKYEALTKEAENAVKRAEPFPPLPAAIAGTKFQFTIPVRFNLSSR